MAKQKLPPAKNWEEREVKDWNAVTFHEYMRYLHKKHYGTSYVAKNMAIQNKNIKRMYEEFGKEVTKRFIELCFKNYRPSNGYSGANFMFFYSYLKDRYLPMAEQQLQKEQQREKRKDQVKEIDENELDKFFS